LVTTEVNLPVSHLLYMQRCIELAQLGAGCVAPNPLVGCVIVHNKQIIGEGYHQKYGDSHAEVNAINAVSDASLLPHSTLYVNLEPCAHFGKTPPCSDLIIRSGIKKVFVACKDSFSKVNGQGIEKMKKAGIEVDLGTYKKEAIELNKRFFTFYQQKRPYIILKWAETKDCFVDKKRTNYKTPSLKITGETANILVHKWRSEEAAIMVGKNTVILDNPSLTTRKYNGQNSIRILLDSNLETPISREIYSGSCRTIILSKTERKYAIENLEYESINKKHEIRDLKIKNTHNIKEVLSALYKLKIQSIIIEGGPTLHHSFYNTGLWDEIRRFVSPTRIENGVASLQLNIDAKSKNLLDKDTLYIYRNT